MMVSLLRTRVTLAIGKLIRTLSRLLHHGGSALPGKIVEHIDPHFLARVLGQLPHGVVLVSGTNGKTTTTRMVATMLERFGLRVFTNPTGSNFTRGVVSSLVSDMNLSGKLDADIAVLELDEAYAVHFVREVKPRYSLLLNVLRDQLDRFGEIDHTADLLGVVAQSTTGVVVLNREDPRIASLVSRVAAGAQVRYFGLSDELLALFPTDEQLHSSLACGKEVFDCVEGLTAATRNHHLAASIVLKQYVSEEATFEVAGQEFSGRVPISGVYNIYNAAAAMASVQSVLDHGGIPYDEHQLVDALGSVRAAFGRGERIMVGSTPVELVLVKNPIGFTLALRSYDHGEDATMIAIRDEYADGRDMSWLWDVDFSALRSPGVAMVSGTRAWDMALRLAYDQVHVQAVEPEIEAALERFLHGASQQAQSAQSAHSAQSAPHVQKSQPKRIFCTYTSMLKVRAYLSRIAHVDDAGVGA